MSDCLFCKIWAKEIPAEIVYQSEKVLGFKDLYPQAKNHFLFIHRNHTKDIAELVEEGPEQLAELMKAISEVGQKLCPQGYRIVNNRGADGGQTVFHTHFHLLGGEHLGKFGA